MFFIRIYDFFAGKRKWLLASLACISCILAAFILRLQYSEDIGDFLPLGTSEREALNVYQKISGAERLFIICNNPSDPDMAVEAMNCLEESLLEADNQGWSDAMVASIDMESISLVSSFVCRNAPYFLSPADIARMDSLLCDSSYIARRLKEDRNMLMFPSGSIVATNIKNDPLGLFSPVLAKLQQANGTLNFEMYDGHIFTPDMSRCILMLDSPYGNSETVQNARMLETVQKAIDDMHSRYPEISAHVVGGPAIAVENSSRIKKDSVLAICLSVILIAILFYFSIASLRNILLIFLSIGWGWLFALGGMALFSSNVSIIVIGISSVILGIAVNYPLHMIAHISHEGHVRNALKDIVAPLLVGNITTVGAFLALVPLRSTALRDLGIFASLLLVGTIVFVLVYLPHFVKPKRSRESSSRILDALARFSPENHRGIVLASVAVTAVLAVFSFNVSFDSNLSNINYMTKTQREDMQYFQELLSGASAKDSRELYVISSGDSYDEALASHSSKAPVIEELAQSGKIISASSAGTFLASRQEQEQRLQLWKDFVSRHRESLTTELAARAKEAGFSASAFRNFTDMVEEAGNLQPQDMDYFQPLTSTVLMRNVTSLDETGKKYIVDLLNVPAGSIEELQQQIPGSMNIAQINSSIAGQLSDNFNYIGWACSLIVFFFLWFSFGRLELAIISFLPMAVSWIWILGIMGAAGISFNIVNVILATFIFGQGDDYTIFVTEGCQYEYAHRKPILVSYKKSIIQSALIMFIGIGTLIFAKHPAMHSLAQVTIIGMFSVVLMAYLIPPFLFRWLTTKNGRVRKYPLTLRSILFGAPASARRQVEGRYIYKGMGISRSVSANLKKNAAQLSAMQADGELEYSDEGYGECAILLALTHPDVKISARIQDPQRRNLAIHAAEDFVTNIEFKE